MARHFLRNPGFELGDTGWTLVTGGSIENDAGNARAGAWVLKHIGDSVSRHHLNSTAHPARPGGSFDVSGYIKGGTAGSGAVRTVWLDKDGAQLSTEVGSGIAFGGSYQESVDTVVAPDLAKSVQFGFIFYNTPTGTWYADDIDVSGDLIRTIPSVALISNHRLLESRTVASFDPLIGSTKFSEFNAGKSDKWVGSFTFIPLHPDGDLGELIAFLTKLGRYDRFFAYDPDRQVPKNGVVNGLEVDGATQLGDLLKVSGGTASTIPLVEGDYVEIGTQYYRVLDDLEIGPEGTGLLHIWPAVRTSPADAEPIITDHPAMIARVTSDIPSGSDHTKWTELTVSWEEV